MSCVSLMAHMCFIQAIYAPHIPVWYFVYELDLSASSVGSAKMYSDTMVL